jgi:DNA replication protein DnaC
MTQLHTTPSRTVTSDEVDQYLRDLKRAFMAEPYGDLAKQAAHKQWSHLDSLGHLVAGEALLRRDRATKNRRRLARFPVLKTLDQLRWDWPPQMNRAQVQHHFTLHFLGDHIN